MTVHETLSRLNVWFEQPFVQNSVVALCALGIGAVVWMGSKNEQWRIAFGRFRRDHVGIFAGAVIAIYLVIGALETIRIPVQDGQWRSVLREIFSKIPQERSYSAPFAKLQLGQEAESFGSKDFDKE